MLTWKFEVRSSPLTLLKKLRRAVKEELKFLGYYWFVRYLPEHFKPSAMSKYGYVFRTVGYMRRKRAGYTVGKQYTNAGEKIAGHEKPLFWSGDMMRAVTGRMKQPVTSTPNRATVWLGVGQAIVYLHANEPKINMAEEMTTLALSEAQDMAKVLEKRLIERLRPSKL